MKFILILFSIIIVSIGTCFSQAWTALTDIPVSLAFPIVVALDGNIHVIGGGGPNGATDLHLRYRPSTNAWDTLSPVPYKAQQPGGAVVNGRIHYFGGGYPNSGTRLDDHYAYDPSSNSWLKQQDMLIPRVIHKTATLGDTIYVLSGQPDKSRVDIFTTSDSSWKRRNDLPDGNFWYSAMSVHNNTLYRFGGGGSISAVTSAHIYNQKTDKWTALSSLSQTNHAPSAEVLGDSIYITGGYVDYRYSDKSLVYDVNTQSYGKGPSFPEGRSYHSMVRIDNCIYSVGGHNDGFEVNTSLIRHCLGDPFTNVSVDQALPSHISISFGSENTMNVHGLEPGQEMLFGIYNLEGKLVWSQSILEPKSIATINLPALINGIYSVVVQSGDGQYWFKLPMLR